MSQFRWAEYHHSQFRCRFAEQRLGSFDLSILNGKALQEGSTMQEYHEFLRTLETVGIQMPAAKTCSLGQTYGWLTFLGNGCSLLLVCWLGGQLWYNGSSILGSRGSSISLGTFCTAICCGMTTLLLKPDYGSVVGAREDREEPQDQDVDLINLGVAWTRGNPETCRMTGPTITEAQTK